MPRPLEYYLELAERILRTHELAQLYDDNDLTEEDVLAHLIECGLIEVPEMVDLE
jgi:hypothetical protein